MKRNYPLKRLNSFLINANWGFYDEKNIQKFIRGCHSAEWNLAKKKLFAVVSFLLSSKVKHQALMFGKLHGMISSHVPFRHIGIMNYDPIFIKNRIVHCHKR